MRRNNLMKKAVSVLAVASLMGTMLTGCGGSDKPAEDATEEGAAKEESTDPIKMVIHMNGIDEDLKMQAAMEEIQKMDEYKHVEFEFHGREADFETSVPVAIAGGSQVDVVIAANPMIQQQWADAGTIIPLDDIIAEAGVDYDKEFGPYVENASNNGQIFTIPHNITRWVLYYNKAIFDAAGEPYPDEDVPMTWDEYAEVAKRITSGTGADKKYGAFYLPWGTFTYGDAIMTLGGGDKFYNAEGTSNIEDPAFGESMQRVHDMMLVDGSMQTHADVISSKLLPTNFMNGLYGMGISGGWVLPWIADKEAFPRDFKMGVAPMPVDEGTTTKTWGIVNGFGISPTSADPLLAFNICMDLVRLCAENADVTEEAIRTVPQDTLFSALEDELADDDITVDLLKKMFTNEETIFVGEKIMGANNVPYEKVYMEEVEKYLVDEQDLATTISNIKERGDKAIKGE